MGRDGLARVGMGRDWMTWVMMGRDRLGLDDMGYSPGSVHRCRIH